MYDQTIDYTKCRFVSDGTWFDEGTDVECESFWFYEDGDASGEFRGIRTCEKSNAEAGRSVGEKYKDGEVCLFEEFDIYLNNKLVYDAEKE